MTSTTPLSTLPHSPCTCCPRRQRSYPGWSTKGAASSAGPYLPSCYDCRQCTSACFTPSNVTSTSQASPTTWLTPAPVYDTSRMLNWFTTWFTTLTCIIDSATLILLRPPASIRVAIGALEGLCGTAKEFRQIMLYPLFPGEIGLQVHRIIGGLVRDILLCYSTDNIVTARRILPAPTHRTPVCI